ncbi:hypothetical protein FRC10_008780 [Ceratobasidium sp. 414]|nr:hypothetical protein FRC10_008780 [Ceratobasidium sp. 414]
MLPKRRGNVKAALNRVGGGLHHLFRSRPATESNVESTTDLKNTDWDGLERFQNILNMNVEAFGPLPATIGRFSEDVKMFENQARTREEYKKLGIDLSDLFGVLAQRFEGADLTSTPLDNFGTLARWVTDAHAPP